jgi:hypothetical protein
VEESTGCCSSCAHKKQGDDGLRQVFVLTCRGKGGRGCPDGHRQAHRFRSTFARLASFDSATSTYVCVTCFRAPANPLRTCERCGKPVTRRSNVRFCGGDCMYEHHKASRRRETCDNPKCNRGEAGGRKVFEVWPSAPPRRFCARSCKTQFERRRERRQCTHCGEQFSCLRSSVQRYCTRDCYRAAAPAAAAEILSAYEAGLRGAHHFKNNLGVGLNTVYDVLRPAKPGSDQCDGECAGKAAGSGSDSPACCRSDGRLTEHPEASHDVSSPTTSSSSATSSTCDGAASKRRRLRPT